jgi:hypothetical protein
MKQTHAKYKRFKYVVECKRTADWWSGGWRERSEWCVENIGTDWDYFDECFTFKDSASATLFILRWK